MRKPKFKLYSSWGSWSFYWLPRFKYQKLRWKDKFETPRCETPPRITFEWLWFTMIGIWGDDEYWEQWLWIHKYYDGDEQKARSEWPWTWGHEHENAGQSTWIDY